MKDTKKVTSDDELHPSGRGKPHKDLGRQVRTFQGVSTANIVHSAFWSLKIVPITRPRQKCSLLPGCTGQCNGLCLISFGSTACWHKSQVFRELLLSSLTCSVFLSTPFAIVYTFFYEIHCSGLCIFS